MKATLRITLKTDSAEEGQQFFHDLCEKLKKERVILDCRFEIETAEGRVTEKCVLSGETVIA
jgi:hypothetical protein